MSLFKLFAISLMGLVLAAQHNLFAPSATSIYSEFNVTTDEKEYMNAAFYPCAIAAAIVYGVAIDMKKLYGNRISAMSLTVLVSQMAASCIFFINSYGLLVFVRALSGLAIGAVIPLSYSLIGDMFQEESRGKAISFYSIAFGLGGLLGKLLASVMGLKLGWRAPFLFLGIIGSCVCLPFLFDLKDPVAYIESKGKVSCFKFCVQSLWLLIVAAMFNGWSWASLTLFAHDFLSQEKQHNYFEAIVVVLCFAVFGLFGLLLGGVFVDSWWTSKPKTILYVASVSVLVGSFPFFAIINSESAFLLNCFYASASGLLIMVSQITRLTALLNLSLQETRGSIVAFSVVADESGKALGVLITGLISVNYGRNVALNSSLAGWIAVSLCCALTALTVTRDLCINDHNILSVSSGSSSQTGDPIDPIEDV